MINVIQEIICTTFDTLVGRWQSNNEIKIAMGVSFNINLDYDKEDGYRRLDMVLYAPMNYVGVLVRERWDVTRIDQPEDTNVGMTDWMLSSYHDTCWVSDGVRRTIRSNIERINGLHTNLLDWYEKIEMTTDMVEIFDKLTSTDRNIENYYEVGKNVFQF